LDDIGRSDFEPLHARASRRRWRAGNKPTVLCAFDLLVDAGRSVMARPLIERKSRLSRVLDAVPENLLYVRHIDASMVDLPISWLYQHALSLGLEGVVGKGGHSPCAPGQRSEDWLQLMQPGAVPPEWFRR
jgi:bifunctional non-homologous end joining protein LigD